MVQANRVCVCVYVCVCVADSTSTSVLAAVLQEAVGQFSDWRQIGAHVSKCKKGFASCAELGCIDRNSLRFLFVAPCDVSVHS